MGGMNKRSAGVLLFRRRDGRLEVLLIHPGGPLWAGRDEGAWSIPKGEIEPGEDTLAAARREFHEETGGSAEGPAIALTPCQQKGGKIVEAWAVEGDFDPARFRSNTFSMEWPPRSGRRLEVPEADRAAWFELGEARRKILVGQRPLLEELARGLAGGWKTRFERQT